MADILAVDDNEELSIHMAEFLQSLGHQVCTAHSGSEAYDFLGAKDFDLLILDWELPDANGPEICRSYRDRGGEGGVLMLTGRDSPQDKVLGLKAGADDYLTKPFNIPEFEARIAALLRRVARPKRTAEIPVDDNLIGHTFGGRYKILSVLGRGAWGIVYKAEHSTIKKTVAIKVLTGKNLGFTANKRFEREAKAMSMLSHPALIEIFDFGLAQNEVPYIVMEYVEGKPLSTLLKDEGPMPVREALELFIQICDGLEHAHTQGIIHRDLKPSNIMVSPDKTSLKILDLGVAKFMEDEQQKQDENPELTFDGEIFGSPLYMSPEQGTNKPIDYRTDIYSMGCIMFETLTSKVPLSGRSFVDIMNARLHNEPPLLAESIPGVYFPPELERAVKQSLNRMPSKRQTSFNELRNQLETALAGLKSGKKTTKGFINIVKGLLGQ